MRLEKEKSLLLAIDIQERLCDAIGKSAGQNELDLMLKNSHILLQSCNILNIPIVESLQYVKGLGESVLSKNLSRTSFEKYSFSVMYEESLLCKYLSENPHIDTIIIAGMESHICVLQSARDLLENGLKVVVASDCVISRNMKHKMNALAFINQCGGVILNVESIVFDWLQSSKSPHFKAISALIK